MAAKYENGRMNNTTVCCGKKRDGNYCPSCGKALKNTSVKLDGLLVHCQNTANSFIGRVSKLETDISEKPDTYWQAGLPRTEQNHHRWSEWARLLGELMESSGEGSDAES